MDWKGRPVLVTGGASFIGARLVDYLVERGADRILVVDDLSSGLAENLQEHMDSGVVQFMFGDLLLPETARAATVGVDTIFHLAAIHGGRGYVDLHQSECARNFALDSHVVSAASSAGVRRFVFASSGCIYPNYVQQDVSQELYLTEDMAGPPYDADHLYGWAKLMCEQSLQAAHHELGMESVSCRLFTVYGERGVENHAVMAMIARAFIGQDPFEVWGDGSQIRNWTYVGDIARGLIAAAESDVVDGTAVNLGTMERTSVLDAVKEVLRYTGHRAEIKFLPEMPTGPLNRVASNHLARRLLGWEPELDFFSGLHRTIDWYFSAKQREVVGSYLERMLTERGQQRAAEPRGATA